MKKNIGFFLNYKVCKDTNLSNVLKGNPGIGGTEYTTIVLALLLSSKSYNVIVYSEKIIDGLPPSITNIILRHQLVLDHFDSTYGGIFVHHPKSSREMDYDRLCNTKLIIWNHLDNYERSVNNIISFSKQVVANVFLTKEQANTYAIFPGVLRKSVIIGHFGICDEKRKINNADLNVTFIGSTSQGKSLHILTEAWPAIVHKIPGAHLYICGSAKLYNKKETKGSLGLADDWYERKIIKPLLDGNVINTVSFLGNLSLEKRNRLLDKTKIGIVNPSNKGLKETFCLSAIEFGAHAIPVVCGDYEGLKNTVPNRCGFRVKNKKQLINKVVSLLNNTDLNVKFGENYYRFVKYNYSLDKFIDSWLAIIEKPNEVIGYKVNFIKKIICFIKYCCHRFLLLYNFINKR